MSEQQEYNSVQVKIYDREYVLRTTGDPERLKELCHQLDKRMREIAASSGTADTMKVAVFAAISLADDLQKAWDELKKFDESVGRRTQACTSILDRFLS
jgi:cell division protein ZapA (FtsZ GTPase activity inhibitor)